MPGSESPEQFANELRQWGGQVTTGVAANQVERFNAELPASRRDRARVAPMTGDGSVEELTVITRRNARTDLPDQASAEQRVGEESALDVLGLRDRLNRPDEHFGQRPLEETG